MIVKLLTEHYLEFLSLKGGFTGSSESTLVKMSNCWKPHAMAQCHTLKDWKWTIFAKKTTMHCPKASTEIDIYFRSV